MLETEVEVKKEYKVENWELLKDFIEERKNQTLALLIGGVGGSGKTTFAEMIKSNVEVAANCSMTIFDFDWVLKSRWERATSKTFPLEMMDHSTWFRIPKAARMISRLLSAQDEGDEKVKFANVYIHGGGEGYQPEIEVETCKGMMIEGFFANHLDIQKTLRHHGVNPINIVLKDDYEEVLQRVVNRAKSRNADPDQQRERFKEIYYPNWEKHYQEIAPWINLEVVATDNKFIIQKPK